MILRDEILTNFTANSTSFSGSVFNAKEKDYESGFHYYGSRYYSSELSIWNSTDPMADKYPSLTPYNYCANNPVKLIDPNGEEIWIVGDDGMRTQYKYGTKYEGNDKFTQETFKALDRDHQHYETGKKIDIFANDITLSGESLSKENRHNISIIKGEETFVNENATLTRTNEGRKIEATISFNNRLGLQSIKNGKYLSPPTCLFHELGHLIDLLFVPGYNDRLNKYNNLFGGNEEEKFNIENNEHPLAKYFGEYERQTYSNGIRVVIDNEQKIFK